MLPCQFHPVDDLIFGRCQNVRDVV
jgi:hypothetical protein